MKVAGAAYLIYLASGMVRDTRNGFNPKAGLPHHSARRPYAMGITTCLLNPKIALMYGALLPQFVRPADGPTAPQLIELGLVQIVVATVMNAMWVLLASQVSRLLSRSRRAERGVRWQPRVC